VEWSFLQRVLVKMNFGPSFRSWVQLLYSGIFSRVLIFRISKILFPFVWGKKREWMARSSISQPLAQGGLGVVDVSCKLASLRVFGSFDVSVPSQDAQTSLSP
jgi:hypothetical protein